LVVREIPYPPQTIRSSTTTAAEDASPARDRIREWLAITDQRDGDRRLIEVVPAGSSGLRPEEIVFLTFAASKGRMDAKAYGAVYLGQLKAGCVNGDVTALFVKQTSQDAGFTATITGDAMLLGQFRRLSSTGRPKHHRNPGL
jgi:hypothetical protein